MKLLEQGIPGGDDGEPANLQRWLQGKVLPGKQKVKVFEYQLPRKGKRETGLSSICVRA